MARVMKGKSPCKMGLYCPVQFELENQMNRANEKEAELRKTIGEMQDDFLNRLTGVTADSSIMARAERCKAEILGAK